MWLPSLCRIFMWSPGLCRNRAIVVWIFCCQNFWITQSSNYQKNYGNTATGSCNSSTVIDVSGPSDKESTQTQDQVDMTWTE